jgi:hypothetical protein
LPRTEIDLGELHTANDATQVAVHNPGTAPLQLEVESSCTCAVVQAPATIAPGQSAAVDVKLKVGTGPQRARLRLTSNDPRGARNVLLTWRGRYQPMLAPRGIAATVPTDEVYRRTLQLVYPGGEQAIVPQLVKVECVCPLVTIATGANVPTAFQSGTQTTAELAVNVAVLPLEHGRQLNTHADLTWQHGTQTTVTRLHIDVRFWGGAVTPAAPGVLFAAASATELPGQVRSLRLSQRNAADVLEVADVPAWLMAQIHAGELRCTLQSVPPADQRTAIAQVGVVGQPQTRVPVRIQVFAP